MPIKRSIKGFPCKPQNCYISRHLEGPDYKVYDQMKAAAQGGDMFYGAVVPYLCNAVNQSRSAVDATLDRLEAAGWIVNLGRTRRADGTETPNRYKIVSHHDWIKDHPGQCPDYKYAPDFETAEQFGVSKGSKLVPSGIPINFWDEETPLGRALRKTMGEGPADIITDEESEALAKHMGASLGQQEPLPVAREWTTPGTPESPLPANEKSRSRLTGKNPKGTYPKENLPTHPHTPLASPNISDRVSVCAENESAIGFDFELEKIVEGFLRFNGGDPPQISPGQRKQLKEKFKRHSREEFRGALRAWLKAQPWDRRTTHPFASLLSGWEGYIAKSKYDLKEAAGKLTEEQEARTKRIAAIRHALHWEATHGTPERRALKEICDGCDRSRWATQDIERAEDIVNAIRRKEELTER